jgi:hypothetical protein
LSVPRTVDGGLDELLELAPTIAIDGPKGVGKTATAQRRATAAWLLDDPNQRALVEADPAFVTAPLIAEWQRLQEIWDTVRRKVDAGAPPGRFLLTGSATPAAGFDTHSGAGRILSLRMRPMALYERGSTDATISLSALIAGKSHSVTGETDFTVTDYFDAIEFSGFPGIRRQPARLRRRLLDSYLQRVIDRDLPENGFTVRRPETLRRWLAAYAAASSTTTPYSRILDASTAGDGSQPAKTTTISYRDHFFQLWLLDPVPGWSPSRNPMTRLQQAPKHQLADCPRGGPGLRKPRRSPADQEWRLRGRPRCRRSRRPTRRHRGQTRRGRDGRGRPAPALVAQSALRRHGRSAGDHHGQQRISPP